MSYVFPRRAISRYPRTESRIRIGRWPDNRQGRIIIGSGVCIMGRGIIIRKGRMQ